MDRRHKANHNPAASQPRAGSLLGLLVLLPYLLLPLIYPLHLTSLPPPAGCVQTETGFPVLCRQPPTSTPPERHDSSCPICTAASSFQDYSCSTSLPLPDNPALAHPVFSAGSMKYWAASLRGLSAPRAPPWRVSQA